MVTSARTRPVRRAVAAALAILAVEAVAAAATLRPDTLDGWRRYVAAVETRRAHEEADPHRFLTTDFGAGAGDKRQAALNGALVIEKMRAPDPAGDPLDVPGALAHHWRGLVFLPATPLASLLPSLETEAPPTGPDILASTVLERRPGFIKVFLRLRETRFVTVVYDTEHEVTFVRLDPDRATSASIATRIAEVGGDDHGFLWRLNAYWRYEAVSGGVLAECESISLSRKVPLALRLFAAPFIRSAARQSMAQTLAELRRRAG